MIGRRQFLAGAGALALAAARPSAVPAEEDGEASLATRARRKGLSFGTSVSTAELRLPALRAAVAREADLIVAQNELKWWNTEARRGQPTYGAADAIMNAPEFEALTRRGHTAVWYRSIPDWAKAEFSAGRGEAATLKRVRDIVAHYRGRIVEWDVVNEAVWPADGRPDGLRDTPLAAAGGLDLMADCFRAAHEADPDARLYYNDYAVEYASPGEDEHRAAILTFLEAMKRRNVPIHGFGVQGHLTVGNRFRERVFARFLADLAALDLKIRITEMDVSDQRLPADFALRDGKVADHARQFLDVAFDQPAVVGLVTWGLADPSPWLDAERARPDRLPQRALPLDRDFARKPLWTAIARSLDGAAKRG
ncbi:beta-xylanase [Aureimonas endophytica]|uniref:Beta-xylanase n=1 Tax=Aureimonas endophytica TaxID=2027858 RepID=A0A916ZJM4_9HYPH|nr:endo-1,4-beta-xylanase [Aureimonas endophytica]GGE01152.1 beta-xylanase [Aureimonas endophytica]